MKPKLITDNPVEKWAILAHHKTNHFYDEYLPYEFHLRMVVKNAEKFLHLLSEADHQAAIDACWLHDVIEDARENYSSVQKVTNTFTAEIVRAVTNYSRGRNRHERMPPDVYADIRDTECATFVKLCDRIANVQYSKMTGSPMFDKYKKEHEYFKGQLHHGKQYDEMWDHLQEIFDSRN